MKIVKAFEGSLQRKQVWGGGGCNDNVDYIQTLVFDISGVK